MGSPQWMHLEEGNTIDSPFGNLQIQTFKKLPNMAPKIKINVKIMLY